MDILKKIFPFSFKAKELVPFIITIVIYLVIDLVCGFAIGLLSHIPVVNILTGILGTLLGLYGLIGIVLSILVFLKVVK
ncbi:MAG: hypothetical protein IKM53_04620 [Clostridia bacterium]|nr:hypothetical protein [Clostridia bacterium]